MKTELTYGIHPAWAEPVGKSPFDWASNSWCPQ
jgi:hypothetical protein